MRFRSLRSRLLVVTISLLALGLVAADLAAYLVLRSHLVGRTDANLELAAGQLEAIADGGSRRGLDAIARIAPPEVFLAFIDSDGEVIETPRVRRASGQWTPDDLLAIPLDGPTTTETGTGAPYRMVRVDLSDGAVEASTSSGSREVAFVVLGLPMQDTTDALRLLVVTEVVSAVVVLLVAVGLASGALRLGLLPLRQMARTARAIEAGDHGERIPVTERGTELADVAEALNAAFDARAESEQSMREFLADASHELRTPVAVVHGWSDLYREGGLSDWASMDEAMDNISRESSRMWHLVEDMLTLARVGSPAPPRPTAVDVDALVTDVARSVASRHADHDVTVLPHAGRLVRSDPDALHRAVSNLVANACLHTPAGTTVVVATALVGGEVRITVEDDGPGLSDAERDRAFDRFWRAGTSRIPVGAAPAGTGLGLAIARAAVRTQGGDVTLEGRDPHGLRAVIAVPLASGSDLVAGPDRAAPAG